MARYFRGVSSDYHTDVTVTKGESIVIWITGLLLIASFILSFIFIKSVFIAVFVDFAMFAVVVAIWISILFSSKHKGERIENIETSFKKNI